MSPIDTAKERREAEGGQEPAPDGTIDAADRAVAAGEYPMGLAGAGTTGLSVNIYGDGFGYTAKRR